MTLNIVIPMAGRGQRFVDAGYTDPKPLIPVHGVPMIARVIENLRPRGPHRFIFVVLQEHLRRHDLADQLSKWSPECVVLATDGVTEGAACTVLLASEYIDNGSPLLIANCDQWVDASINDFIADQDARGLDGLIMTMTADDPKWSFARMDAHGHVTEVAEKRVISRDATVGLYLYRKGAAFVEAARAMIAKNIRVNGEFYVAPVYNEMIAAQAKIGCCSIGSVNAGMYGLGTPDDLVAFLAHPASQHLVGIADHAGR